MAQRPQPAAAARRPPFLAWSLLVALGPTAYYAWSAPTRERTPREIGAHFRARFAPSTSAPSPSSARRSQFQDATVELGVDFVHDNDAHGEFRLPEQMGPGVAWLDYDGDGDVDLFVAGGGSLHDSAAAQRCRLLRNDGARFTDVSAAAGADLPGHAYGVAAADYDDDGDVDLLVTRLGATELLRNDGGKFARAGAQSGVSDSSFGSSAAFFDYDRDGRLDVFVGHYMDWKPELERECAGPSGARDYCDPTRYGVYAQSVLYRNLGDGRFEDVTARAGLANHTDQTLGVVAADFDADGWTDLYVAEDSVPAKLWRNLGDGRFAESALAFGCAFDSRGMAIAGMGVACDDIDGDGRLDLLVTNIRGQSHLVLLGAARGFHDASAKHGVPRWSIGPTGFGVALFDADLDGAFEAYVANGAVAAVAEPEPGASRYAERDQFVEWRDGKFVDATGDAGFVGADVGRGLACADFDDDGDLDLALASNGGRLRILRNTQSGGSWLVVDVRTRAGAPAIGARVRIECAGRSQRREIRPQSSYLSSHDPRAHFGLAGADEVERVEVTWPDGALWTARNVAARQRLVISRADATAEAGR